MIPLKICCLFHCQWVHHLHLFLLAIPHKLSLYFSIYFQHFPKVSNFFSQVWQQKWICSTRCTYFVRHCTCFSLIYHCIRCQSNSNLHQISLFCSCLNIVVSIVNLFIYCSFVRLWQVCHEDKQLAISLSTLSKACDRQSKRII